MGSTVTVQLSVILSMSAHVTTDTLGTTANLGLVTQSLVRMEEPNCKMEPLAHASVQLAIAAQLVKSPHVTQSTYVKTEEHVQLSEVRTSVLARQVSQVQIVKLHPVHQHHALTVVVALSPMATLCALAQPASLD